MAEAVLPNPQQPLVETPSEVEQRQQGQSVTRLPGFLGRPVPSAVKNEAVVATLPGFLGKPAPSAENVIVAHPRRILMGSAPISVTDRLNCFGFHS
jgi:hypothetical protein